MVNNYVKTQKQGVKLQTISLVILYRLSYSGINLLYRYWILW